MNIFSEEPACRASVSPLLSNIMLDELDKELARQGHKYIRYADDFNIYAKSKPEARKIGNATYVFLRDKLKSPINREMPEHGSAKGTHVVLASAGQNLGVDVSKNTLVVISRSRREKHQHGKKS